MDMRNMNMQSVLTVDIAKTKLQQAKAEPIEPFQTPHAHAVFALAAAIMKHCPLCSSGLDGALLAPILAFILVLLACWFAVVRFLATIYRQAYIYFSPDFIQPLKHAPPLFA